MPKYGVSGEVRKRIESDYLNYLNHNITVVELGAFTSALQKKHDVPHDQINLIRQETKKKWERTHREGSVTVGKPRGR